MWNQSVCVSITMAVGKWMSSGSLDFGLSFNDVANCNIYKNWYRSISQSLQEDCAGPVASFTIIGYSTSSPAPVLRPAQHPALP